MFLSKCRVCFSDNLKMYELSKTRFQEIFEKNTGQKLIIDRRPGKVCYLCNQQMKKFSHFIEMSLKTEKYLSESMSNGLQKSIAHPLNQLHNLTISPVQYFTSVENDFEADITAERDHDDGVVYPVISIDQIEYEVEADITPERDHDDGVVSPVISIDQIEYEVEADITAERDYDVKVDVNRIESVDMDNKKNLIQSVDPPIDLDYQENLVSEDSDDVCLDYEDTDTENYLEEPEEEIDVVNVPNQDLLVRRNCDVYIPKVTLERISVKQISQYNGHSRQQKNKSYHNCSECNFKCVSKQVLNRHRQVHTKEQCKPKKHGHKNNLRCVCNICGQTFEKQCYLNKHIKLHNNEQSYPCDLCGKKYKHHSSFLVHMRTHTGEKPFGCMWCDKKFNDKSNCRKHIKSHSVSFVCYMCNKLFQKESDLKRHVVEHIM